MHVIAIANNKGGVGKTTSTQNIGAAIATFANKKTLLIDLDPQASLSKSFGIYLEPHKMHAGTFLLGKCDLKDAIITYNNSNLDILPTSMELVQNKEEIKKTNNFPFNLLHALEKYKTSYDFVIVDCPPGVGTLTTIALTACSRYYVPLQAEYFSYEGLRDFISYTGKISSINPNIKLGGVFATRFNPHSRKNFSRNLIQAVKEQLGNRFLQTYIRDNIALSEAQAKKLTIFDYDKKSNGAQDYYNLTKEILYGEKF
ncbi:MAG: chromosome partitioning protein [Candidatus Amoebophilus sp. 36-38]|nr:MAG: chromosome partitioning protein [Candidatus Amoebophilus sp. 36-38]